MREGEFYYCLSTDTNLFGVQISRSRDLLHWELYKTAFESMPLPISRHTGAKGFWAPELIRVGDEYRLYCCASAFGTTQSTIALAKARSIEDEFEYVGDVLRTYHNGRTDSPNAIDPNVVQDRDGRYYMAYGSFFGGIYIAPLDEEGFLAEAGYGTLIAGGAHTAVEGPYIYYDEASDLYNLFVSYGSLTYDYNIRVGRAQDITGPYLDSQGYPLTDLDPVHSVGDKLAGGYDFDLPGEEGFMAPGHNSVVLLDDGPYVVHHVRRAYQANPSYLHLRKIYYLTNGQILLSPVVRDATPETLSRSLPEHFSCIRLDRWNNGVTYGRKLRSDALDCRFEGEHLLLSLDNQQFKGYLLSHGPDTYLTAISETGECLWAKGYEED